MNGKVSPITPKKRYSCASEYATPKEADESDSSLYYSFSMSEDDGLTSKENSANGGQWTVSHSASRIPKAKTPLLRKVLQPNYTPRNQNNKRVSFSYASKVNPTPEISVKVPKIEPHTATDSNPSTTFDMKPIEEKLKSILKENEQKSIDTIGTSANINDSGSDVTDDLENDLHDTIIANPLSTAYNFSDGHGAISVQPNNDVPVKDEKTGDVLQTLAGVSSDQVNKNLESEASIPNASNGNVNAQCIKTVDDVLRGAIKNESQTRNSAKSNRQRLANESRKSVVPVGKKTARATTYKRRSSIYEPRKVDPRKSLGVLKHAVSKVTKSITGKFSKFRRIISVAFNNFSTFIKMHRNLPLVKMLQVDQRALRKPQVAYPTLNRRKIPALRQRVRIHFSFLILNGIYLCFKHGILLVETSRADVAKPRLTIAKQLPRVAIMSTRPSISATVRAQRRETKYSFTTLAASKASSSNPPESVPQSVSQSVSESVPSSVKPKFIKPSALPVRNSANSTKGSTTSNGSKCQYCDKYFAKPHGMTTHLLEKCEKIPASARRQLLQKNENSDETKSKLVSRHRPQVEIDSVSKYSRFFVNLRNDDASGMQGGGGGVTAINVENGLKNLRAELRKIKNAHTGIIRTPSKPIRCHICKKYFLDCVEYADHSTNHPAFN